MSGPLGNSSIGNAASLLPNPDEKKKEQRPTDMEVDPSGVAPDSKKENLPPRRPGQLTRKIRPFYLHQWLDVLDTDKKWLEAQVVEIDPGQRKMLIHYKGWKKDYDEWLSMDENHEHSKRIALLHTYFAKPVKAGEVRMECGVSCDVQDTAEKWMEGIISDLDWDHELARVRYLGWSAKYDEWLQMDSYRLAPRGAYIQRAAPPPPSLRRQASGNFNPTWDNERAFRALLERELKMQIVDQKEDGNCLFRSVSHQVYGTPDYHSLVRAKCMEYITSERYFYKNFIAEQFEVYVERLKRDGEWGDNPEIQAMSEIYNRPIQIFAYSKVPMRTYDGPNNKDKPMRLSYHFRSHYNSIIGLDEDKHNQSCLKSAPGQVEDAHIKKSRLGGGSGLNRHKETTDRDDPQLRAALSASREQFNKGALDEMERAILESLKPQHEQGGAGVVVHEDPVEQAIQQSLLESHAGKGNNNRQQNEDESIRRAIEESLKSATGTSSQQQPLESKNTAPGGTGNERKNGAPSEQLQHDRKGNGSGTAQSSQQPTPQSSPSPAPAKSTTASPSAKKDRVLARLQEFGFERDKCATAYDKVNSGSTDKIDEEILFGNTLNFMMR